jgi:HlyD family secretion protein
MDHVLTKEQRRARRLQLTRPWIAALLVIVALSAWALHQLSPSLKRSSLSVATVQRGPIEAVVSGTGTVVPALEQTVSSPISAEVRKVLVSLGETVTAGQPILELDKTAAELALGRLQQELALKREELRSIDLQLADATRESRSRRDLLAIDLEARDVRLGRLTQLGEPGPVSAQELLEAKLNVKRTRIELEQIGAQVVSLEARRKAEVESRRLACSIIEKEIADQTRRLQLASVSAPRDGVVTHLVDQQGAAVTEGQVLATVAGQDSFRIEASLSNFYAPQLKAGQRVKVQQTSGEFLPGHLERIVPSAGAQIALFIALEDPSAPQLRLNARVNVHVITAEKADALRIRRGSALESAGVHEVYVLKGDEAVRTKVRTGLVSSHDIEVTEGLKVGDQVIVSDTTQLESATIAVR